MVEGYYRVVTTELKRLGFRYLTNAKGSHEKWENAAGRLLIVPRNMASRHLANALLQEAGSTRRV